MSRRPQEEPLITAAQCDLLEDLVDQLRLVDWVEVDSAFESVGEDPSRIGSCTRENASQLIDHLISVSRDRR